MNSSSPPPPGLPTSLLNDSWWLIPEDRKPTTVILPFPDRKQEQAERGGNSDEIAVHSSRQQAALPKVLRRGAVGVGLALLFLRKLLKVLGCLKQLLTGLVDHDLLDNGSDFLRLPAILGGFLKMIGGHD